MARGRLFSVGAQRRRWLARIWTVSIVVGVLGTAFTAAASASTFAPEASLTLIASLPSVGEPAPGTRIATGDLRNDGKQDLITVTKPGTVGVFLGNGDGTFASPAELAVGERVEGIAVGDINGDHYPDVVVASEFSISVLTNHGDGTFAITEQIPYTPPTNFSSLWQVRLVDLQGNSRPAIVAATGGCSCEPYSYIAVWPNDGAGRFGPVSEYAVGGRVFTLAEGDFNGDGHIDVAVATDVPHTVAILTGHGDGTLGPSRVISSSVGFYSIQAGDLTHNGRLDLVTAAGEGGAYYGANVLMNEGGDFVFSAPTDFSAGSEPLSLALGDFNDDGNNDIVVADRGSGQLSILRGDGAGSFSAPANFPGITQAWDPVVAAFNTHADIAVTGYGGGGINIYSTEPVAAPTVTRVAPKAGPTTGGTTVKITGTAFGGTTAVNFGPASASFRVNSPTSITATAPAQVAGAVDVRVTTSGGTSAPTTDDRFKFTPTISALSPAAGPATGGTTVTVTGNGFAIGPSGTTIKFGAARATAVNCSSTTECLATAPPHAAGAVEVKATVNKATSPKTSAARFTYG